jgi:glycosyltransferase involved in cell wall biosynthesis
VRVDAVIPAWDEEATVGVQVAAVPRPPVRRVVVADNGSRDDTAAVAREAGAVVVPAPRRGYGSACLAGLDWLRRNDPPDAVVFLDADLADDAAELPLLLAPLAAGAADLVIGSRTLGRRQRGALLPQGRAGNLVACWMIRLLYGHRYTDLGPFRAIRWSALERLGMADPDFGWTAEMQVKALRAGLALAEVPVSYRKRPGRSKISGTVSGTIRAGHKILWTVVRHALGPSTVRAAHPAPGLDTPA